MAHDPEVRQRVRAAYIGGLPLDRAADSVGVAYSTARNWYREAKEKGDDWDRFQAASLIVAGGGLEQAMARVIATGLLRCEALLETLADPNIPPGEAVKSMATLGDTVAKLRAGGKTLMPAADRLAVASDLLRRLDTYLAERYPSLAEAYAEVLVDFGRQVAADYGANR